VELNDRVGQIEDELKILKNEIQAVLLDLRESYLNMENPVSRELPPYPEQHIIVSTSQQGGSSQPQAEREAPRGAAPEDRLESEPSGVVGTVDAPAPTRQTEPSGVQEPLYEPGPAAERQPVAQFRPRAEPETSQERVTVATDERAREEVTRVWRPAANTEARTEARTEPRAEAHTEAFSGSGGNGGHNGQIDLATISSLADWVAGVVKRLGSERAEAILDISEMVGFVDPELKTVLAKFIYPAPGENEGKATTRDYLTSLKELDKILRKATTFEIALLSILCQGNDSG